MRNGIAKAIGTALLITNLSGCPASFKAKEETPKKLEQISLGVGKSRIRPGIGHIMYCGMSNDKTFSLAFVGGFAVNFYYSTRAEKIQFGDEYLRVDSVTPEEIVLTYLKRK